MGELATERVLKIAKAAEAAKRLGPAAARAAGALELGAGDGVGANPYVYQFECGSARCNIWYHLYHVVAEAKRKAEAAAAAAAVNAVSSAAPTSAATGVGGYDEDSDVVYSDGAQALGEESQHGGDPRRSKACAIQ